MEKQMLENKVAIITGASSGIGQAIAQLFAEEGASVVLIGRNEKNLNDTVNGIKAKGQKAIGVLADVTSKDDIAQVFDETIQTFGDLDILVNNAGISDEYAIDETTDEWLNHVLDVNLNAPIRYAREALKYFMPKNDGVIINITSVNGDRPIGGAAYTSSKGALNTLTKNIAMRLSDTKIRCNAVAPGATLTPMHFAHLRGENPGGNLMLEFGKKYCNWNLPETNPLDQAYACLYLASKMGKAVKGQVLQVCNGAFL